jgi:hypothetical protein
MLRGYLRLLGVFSRSARRLPTFTKSAIEQARVRYRGLPFVKRRKRHQRGGSSGTVISAFANFNSRLQGNVRHVLRQKGADIH